jgi:hypothetical protein
MRPTGFEPVTSCSGGNSGYASDSGKSSDSKAIRRDLPEVGEAQSEGLSA